MERKRGTPGKCTIIATKFKYELDVKLLKTCCFYSMPFGFCQVNRHQSKAGLWASECVEEAGVGLLVRAEWAEGCDIRLIVDKLR